MRKKALKKPKKRNIPVFYTKYPDLTEIKCYLNQITRNYPKMIRLEQIGHSGEGRSIDMVVIQGNQCSPKMATMIEGGIHAREWLAHTSVLYFIQYIIEHPEMLEYMDYYIIPCLNPDGYVYTHTCKRLWRKNRNRNGCSTEKDWGVDINRNFSYGYGLPGSSDDTSSVIYRGKEALSEPESQSIELALNRYGKYVKLYIAIHTFGNVIMYPWGYTTKRLCDESDLRACAFAAVEAMKCAYEDSRYKIGPLWKLMYLSSGGSSDFVRGVYHIKFTYTMELQKGGRSGFDPPPSKIFKEGKKTAIGIEAMVNFVVKYYNSKKRNRSYSPYHACKRRKLNFSYSSDSDSDA